jgi:hypothetical protein
LNEAAVRYFCDGERKMKRSLFLVCVFFSTSMFSQTAYKTDFSGTWKMISRKAVYPTPLKSLVYTIIQQGNAIEITSVRDGKKDKVKYLINGENQIIGFSNATSETTAKAYWEGDALNIEITQNNTEEPMGAPTRVAISMTSRYLERYTMSGDGKTLTLTRRNLQTKDQTIYVFEKQ